MFVVGLISQLALILDLNIVGAMRQNTMVETWETLAASYAMPFGVIAAGLFLSKSESRRRADGRTLLVAVTVCLAWNGILVALSARFFFSADADPREFRLAFAKIASTSGFLTAAALTALFGDSKRGENAS